MCQVISCIEDGLPLLIENLPEGIDIVLDNIIGKKTIIRGRATLVKIGDAEIELNPRFRWYILQQDRIDVAFASLTCNLAFHTTNLSHIC